MVTSTWGAREITGHFTRQVLENSRVGMNKNVQEGETERQEREEDRKMAWDPGKGRRHGPCLGEPSARLTISHTRLHPRGPDMPVMPSHLSLAAMPDSETQGHLTTWAKAAATPLSGGEERHIPVHPPFVGTRNSSAASWQRDDIGKTNRTGKTTILRGEK